MKIILDKAVFLASIFMATPLMAEHHDGHRMMEHLDTDKNGQISEAEFLEAKKEHFKKMDKDSNGSLDENEMKMMKEKWHDMKEKRKKHEQD